MHFSTAVVLLTGALGGVSLAHPSGLHNHQHFHEKKAIETGADGLIEARAAGAPQFRKAGKPVKPSTSAPPPPAPTSAAPPPPASSPALDGGSAAYKPFCGGKKVKRATAAQIAYHGNTGVPGQWGCNMMLIDAAAASKYDYTTKFSSTGGSWSCACFNKIGPTNLIDGFWHTAVSFSLGPGESKMMAFDSNSQGGCACGPGASPPKTAIGQWAGTWLEFDWGNDSNGGNSGADASVLVAGAARMPYYGMSVAANGKVCSSLKSDGTNYEAYMPGMEDADGVGCKGYYKGHLDVVLGD